MDDDETQEVARRLFVATTERLETAYEIATEGQAILSGADYIALANRLQAMASEIITLSESIVIVAGQPGENDLERHKIRS